jgi:hypothetical protein
MNIMATITTTTTPAVSFEIDSDELTMLVTFATGDSLHIAPMEMFEQSIINKAMLHGLKQKLGDAAAIGRNPDTGRSATADDKRAAVMEVFERLCSGEWNKTREGGEQGTGLLLAALIATYPAKTRETLTTWLEGKTKEQRAELRKNPKIAATILRIKAERAAAGSDNEETANMLDELND